MASAAVHIFGPDNRGDGTPPRPIRWWRKRFREGDSVHGYDPNIAKSGFYVEYATLKVRTPRPCPRGSTFNKPAPCRPMR
jgi:hypothetical protein